MRGINIRMGENQVCPKGLEDSVSKLLGSYLIVGTYILPVPAGTPFINFENATLDPNEPFSFVKHAHSIPHVHYIDGGVTDVERHGLVGRIYHGTKSSHERRKNFSRIFP